MRSVHRNRYGKKKTTRKNTSEHVTTHTPSPSSCFLPVALALASRLKHAVKNVCPSLFIGGRVGTDPTIAMWYMAVSGFLYSANGGLHVNNSTTVQPKDQMSATNKETNQKKRKKKEVTKEIKRDQKDQKRSQEITRDQKRSKEITRDQKTKTKRTNQNRMSKKHASTLKNATW